MRRTIASSLIALLAAAPAMSQSLDQVVSAQLLPGWRTAQGDHVAALRITLAPGWKTYWRAPGDAGIPPLFDWTGSRNTGAISVSWPTPGVFDQNGMRSIGYADVVTLPLTLRPPQAGEDVSLSGRVDMGVCLDVCIPATLRVTATLPADTKRPDPRIAAALAERPFSATEAGVASVECQIAPAQDGLEVTAHITAPHAGGMEYTVFETPNPSIWVAEAESARDGDTLIARTTMAHVDGTAFALSRSDVRITVLGAKHAIDIQGCTSGG